jgi:hypothetical protein
VAGIRVFLLSGQTIAELSWSRKLTDIFIVGEILGGDMCLPGDVPPALFTVGSASDLNEYCKELIGTAGKDEA